MTGSLKPVVDHRLCHCDLSASSDSFMIPQPSVLSMTNTSEYVRNKEGLKHVGIVLHDVQIFNISI